MRFRLATWTVLTLARRAGELAVFVAALFALAAPARAQTSAQQQACGPARTALVLSGGAAKGFAHVGVLHVLDSLGVKPDLIVGTSVGAMVGAFYASGYSAQEVDSIVRALPFEDVIRRYDPTVSRQLGLLKALAVWERGRTGYRLQTGAAREGEVNALMSAAMLRGNLQARGWFDSLAIPFRAVATNLVTQQPVVIGDGDLALAVRASIALPVMFQPVRRDSTWLIDGALSANAAISQARALGAERVWVSRLPYAPPDRNAYDDPFTLSVELMNSLFKEDTSALRPSDVNIANPTQNFDPLDFGADAAGSLIRLGHETARAAFGAAACIRPLGTRAAAAETGVVVSQIVSVVATGRAHDEAAVLAGLGVVAGRTVNQEEMGRAIVDLGHSERIRAVWLNPRGSAAEIAVTPELLPAPQRAFGVGVAFDHFMSGRLWLGGVDRLVFNTNAEAALIARFGNWEQDAEGFLRVHANIGRGHFPVGLGAKFTHERVRVFDGEGELPAVETNEGEFFIGLRDDPAPGAWRYELMADGRWWREAKVGTTRTAGIRAAVFRARNDHEMAVMADAVVLDAFQRVRVDASRVFALPGMQARARVRAGWGNQLPIQHSFTLGGSDGFAGMHIGEPRGTQEVYVALQLKRRVAPLLNFVVEGMAGAVGEGHGFMVRRDSSEAGRVLGGVRFGFEASTPFGPIRVEEGINSTGARALLVRVGYWF